jgi:glutaredoxin
MSEQAENPEPDDKKQTVKSKRGGLFFIALFVVAMILLSRQQTVNTINCDASIIASKPDVIMLGAWWCSYCYKAKKYFQKNNIHYCEYDMENTLEGKRLYEKHGAGAIPILLIGDYQLNGFSEQQIEAALAEQHKQPD